MPIHIDRASDVTARAFPVYASVVGTAPLLGLARGMVTRAASLDGRNALAVDSISA